MRSSQSPAAGSEAPARRGRSTVTSKVAVDHAGPGLTRRASLVQMPRLRFDQAREVTLGSVVAALFALDRGLGLDCSDIAGAWMQLLRRQEALLSHFPLGDAGVVELHWPEAFELRCEDCVDVNTFCRALLDNLAHEPMDPRIDQLARLYHLHGPAGDYVLLLVDHLLFDGMSTDVFRRDMERALVGGSLPPLRKGYYDFAEAQRELILSDEALLDYWRSRHRSLPLRPTLGVPRRERETPGVRRPVQRLTVEVWDSELPWSISERCHDLRATPFILVGAGLLASMADGQAASQPGLVLPTAGRSYAPWCMDVIGRFSNVLAIGIDVDPSTHTFGDVLDRFRTELCECIEHELVPKDAIVAEMFPDFRSLDPPEPYLFYDMQYGPRCASASALVQRPSPRSVWRSEPGITARLEVAGAGARLSLAFSDAYDPSCVQAFGSRARTFVREIALHPDRRVERWPR